MGLRKTPEPPVRMGHTEVADILARQAPRCFALELRVDVALPEVDGFHQVHVAVKDL